MYGAVITIIATLCQGLTKGPWALFGTRIILGIGTAFEIVAAPTIVAEITHPRTRAQSSALTQTCYYRKSFDCHLCEGGLMGRFIQSDPLWLLG